MPDYGTTTDYMGTHVGSKSARKLVQQLKPALVLSGHIHEAEGQKDKIGKTLLINPDTGLLLKI